MTTVAHICRGTDLGATHGQGQYAPESLKTEGFIHCSTPAQVIATANRFYHGQRGLIVLMIETEKLIAEIKYESADGDSFPHLYGPLNLTAVMAVKDLMPRPDGTFDALSLCPLRWETNAAVEYLENRLHISDRDYTQKQDWAIESADPDRLAEFCQLYDREPLDEGTKFTLMCLLIASVSLSPLSPYRHLNRAIMSAWKPCSAKISSCIFTRSITGRSLILRMLKMRDFALCR